MTTNVVEIVSKAAANPGLAAVRAILPAIHRILADGRPASTQEIAGAIGQSVKETGRLIGLLPNMEFDREGRVLGIGLSLLPTPHRVYLEGREHTLYAWCVPDALIMPGMIGLSARLVSPCHATKQPITVTIRPEGVADVDPAGAVVSGWLSAFDSRDVRGTCCVNQVLFQSEEAARPWLAEHPGASVLPVEETFRLNTQIARQCELLKAE